jgi:hypothetical protein
MAGLIDLSQFKFDPSKAFNIGQGVKPGSGVTPTAAPQGIGDMLKQWAPQAGQLGAQLSAAGGQPDDFGDIEAINNQFAQHLQALNAARMGRY